MKVPKMARPASLATEVISRGLLTDGKGAVESKGAVMKDPSKTERMGTTVPAAGSRVDAVSKRFSCALRMVSRDKAFWQSVSVELQPICPVKLACRVS